MEDSKKIIKDKKYWMSYLDDYYVNLSVDDKEWKYFNKLGITPNKSYIVVHNNIQLLKMFMMYYLVKTEYSFITYDVNTYASDLQNNNLKVGYKNVLILTYSSNTLEFGNGSEYLKKVISQAISTRSWEGGITILLSQKELTYVDRTLNKPIYLFDNLKDDATLIALDKFLQPGKGTPKIPERRMEEKKQVVKQEDIIQPDDNIENTIKEDKDDSSEEDNDDDNDSDGTNKSMDNKPIMPRPHINYKKKT